MRDMMYTLDISGHDDVGNPEMIRYGGLFQSPETAVAYGRLKATTERLVFKPETIWVRDQEGAQITKENV